MPKSKPESSRRIDLESTIETVSIHQVCGQVRVIGWKEWVRLPELNLQFIEAKVDTGAKTSSLDVQGISILRRRNGDWLRFRVFEDQDLSHAGRDAEAKLLEFREVRTSDGVVYRRPVIETSLVLGTEFWKSEITLSDRHSMRYRMLLGRAAIANRFLVDSSRSHLAR
jgi:hypothetical protein